MFMFSTEELTLAAMRKGRDGRSFFCSLRVNSDPES